MIIELKLSIVYDDNTHNEVNLHNFYYLIQELNEFEPVYDVRHVIDKKNTKQSTKSTELVSVTDILIALTVSGGVATSLISLLSNWIQKKGGKSVTVEYKDSKITLTNINVNEQKELIEIWKKTIEKEIDGNRK